MNKHDSDWEYYDDDRISSIYKVVYKRVLEMPETAAFKQNIIDKMLGTTVINMSIVHHTNYYGNWTPFVKFNMAIPGRSDFITTGECQESDRYPIKINIKESDFAAPPNEIIKLFENAINKGIHMHGLMNMYSVTNGTKGGKNKFVPWFLYSTLKSPEIGIAKTEAEARLTREANTLLHSPGNNEMYIKACHDLGKRGIIEQLKNLRHLPLEVIKEALNEFLCTDVMDDFDE